MKTKDGTKMEIILSISFGDMAERQMFSKSQSHPIMVWVLNELAHVIGSKSRFSKSSRNRRLTNFSERNRGNQFPSSQTIQSHIFKFVLGLIRNRPRRLTTGLTWSLTAASWNVFSIFSGLYLIFRLKIWISLLWLQSPSAHPQINQDIWWGTVSISLPE
jgi:hypothetical protein